MRNLSKLEQFELFKAARLEAMKVTQSRQVATEMAIMYVADVDAFKVQLGLGARYEGPRGEG